MAVSYTREHWEFSERRACGLVGIDRSSARYRTKRSGDAALRERLRQLAGERRRFGYRRLHVMLVREVNTKDLEVGDIIQFRAGETRVFHRIIQIADTATGRVFVTQGDNNNTPDDPILEGQIEGQIIFTIPRVGWAPLKIEQLLSKLK